jgi:hypothetical protein
MGHFRRYPLQGGGQHRGRRMGEAMVQVCLDDSNPDGIVGIVASVVDLNSEFPRSNP